MVLKLILDQFDGDTSQWANWVNKFLKYRAFYRPKIDQVRTGLICLVFHELSFAESAKSVDVFGLDDLWEP